MVSFNPNLNQGLYYLGNTQKAPAQIQGQNLQSSAAPAEDTGITMDEFLEMLEEPVDTFDNDTDDPDAAGDAGNPSYIPKKGDSKNGITIRRIRYKLTYDTPPEVKPEKSKLQKAIDKAIDKLKSWFS